MNRDEKKWERGIRKEHRDAQTYIDVQEDRSQVLVAYDGKTGQRYGTLTLEEVARPSKPRDERRGKRRNRRR